MWPRGTHRYSRLAFASSLHRSARSFPLPENPLLSASTRCDGGGMAMNLHLAASARQPTRQPWPMHRLLEERAIALGFALENSTAGTYTLHLNSYLTFCNIHHLPIEPTADTLSFYIVFMCSHIKPSSVESYLSGICNQLEPWFPRVREIRTSALVS